MITLGPASTTSKSSAERPLAELFARLQSASGRDLAFLTVMVELQARLLGGSFGALFTTQGDKPPRVVSVYPLPADHKVKIEPERLAVLRDCAARCRSAGAQSVYRVGVGEQVLHAVCTPLTRRGRVEGVAVVLVTPGTPGTPGTPAPAPGSPAPGNPASQGSTEHDPGLSGRMLQALGVAQSYSGHVARRMLNRMSKQASETRSALAVLGAAHGSQHFEACAMNVCNRLKVELGAWRVSLGWARHGNLKLLAMSETENIDRRQELSLRLEAAMEECFDQQQAAVAPHEHLAGADCWLTQAVARCHHELIGTEGQFSACSVPLRHGDLAVGVLTVEQPMARKFDGQSASHLQAIADLIAPRLSDRFDEDRWLGAKAWQSTRWALGKAVGPQRVGAKLVAVAVLGVLVWSCLAQWEYRIDAPFQLEAGSRRVHAASFSGYLSAVNVEKGDTVQAGQELARLDDSELKLQLREVRASLEEAHTRRIHAISKSNDPDAQSDAKRYAALEQQLQARVDLLQFQIDRAVLRASETGVVLSGDWREKVGVRVELGETVFEVAPIEKLRAHILVDESDVDRVTEGSFGEVATRSYPDKAFPFRVTRVVPVGESYEGRNVFEVRAELSRHENWMRPGMQGAAKLDAGRRRVIWIATHKLIDFLRLKLWM